MGYWANTFDTEAGYRLCESLFRDLYVDPDSDRIITDDDIDSVTNFERNFFGASRGGGGPGATKLRVINVFYDVYAPEFSGDCGIYRCTGCNRVDHMFNWEFLDLSVYNPAPVPQTSTDTSFADRTADLTNQPGGIYGGAAYQIMAHVRCNEVSTCNACGLTFHAPVSDIDSCPECGAGPADSSNDYLGMVQAGCGATGAVVHSVPPLTAEQSVNLGINWSSESGRTNFIELKRSKTLTVKVPRTVAPSSYQIVWAGDNRTAWERLQGQAFKTRGEALNWVPRLIMTLPDGRVSEFPISLFGGYSDRASPLYPGVFAFGGATVKNTIIGGVPTPYLGGYRSPDNGYRDFDARRGCFEVPGVDRTTILGNNRVAIGSSAGTSRRNRDYHTDVLAIDPNGRGSWSNYTWNIGPGGTADRYDGSGRLLDAVVTSNHLQLRAGGNLLSRNRGYGSSGNYGINDIAGELPVLRFRTFQNRAGKTVNLMNPMMRDIDDDGLIRVSPLAIIPDRKFPKSLDPSQVEPQGEPGASCPNDIVAAMSLARKGIDEQDTLAERMARTIGDAMDADAAGRLGVSPDYPFGITDLEEPPGADADLLQSLNDLGLVIPSQAPGTGYSYLVTANRARAGVRSGRGFVPALQRRGSRLIGSTPANRLDSIWLSAVDPDDYDPILFYVRVGGSGTRRDPSTFVPPRQVPRFGSVDARIELVEDPFHNAKTPGLPFYLPQIHRVVTVGRPFFDLANDTKYTTLLCQTCMATYTTGTILMQRQTGGAIANLEIDPNNGVPLRWDVIPRNRAGIDGWMVAAEVAFEGNRLFRTCPDRYRTNPGENPPEFGDHYLAPDANGIPDFRFPTPMGFYRTDQLATIPGYERHDDESVTVSGVEYPIAEPRIDYLLGPHDSRGQGTSILQRAGIGRLTSESGRALYRRHDVSGDTVWIPVMWGVLDEGRMITTEATNLASISSILGGAP